MKKTIAAAVTVAMISVGAAGCSQTTGPNEAGGTVLGAVAGGLVGSAFGGGRRQDGRHRRRHADRRIPGQYRRPQHGRKRPGGSL